MTVRVAGPQDLDAIARTEAEAALHPWTRAQIEEHLRHGLALVAGEPVVGHVLASCVLDEGEVFTIAVRPEARRQGLASALLEALEEAWRARGVVQAFLEVSAPNTGARALYARHGWGEVGLRKRYYSDGSDAVLMNKEVTPC